MLAPPGHNAQPWLFNVSGDDTPFEVAVEGYSEPGDAGLPRAYEEAGATWWLESVYGLRGTLGEMMGRIEAGPPG